MDIFEDTAWTGIIGDVVYSSLGDEILSFVEVVPPSFGEINLSEFKTLCNAEIESFCLEHPKIEAIIDAENNHGFDYRAQDSRISGNCITFLFIKKCSEELLAVVTLIYVDEKICGEFSFLKQNNDCLDEVGISGIATLPTIITGFCQVCSDKIEDKYIVAKWYLNYIERLTKLGLGLLIEVQGVYSDECKGDKKLLIGQVHPQSKPVMTAVRMLSMEKIENCYERNTLGPVYGKWAQRQS